MSNIGFPNPDGRCTDDSAHHCAAAPDPSSHDLFPPSSYYSIRPFQGSQPESIRMVTDMVRSFFPGEEIQISR